MICEGVLDPNFGAVSWLLVKLLNLLGFESGRAHSHGSVETGWTGRAQTMQSWCSVFLFADPVDMERNPFPQSALLYLD